MRRLSLNRPVTAVSLCIVCLGLACIRGHAEPVASARDAERIASRFVDEGGVTWSVSAEDAEVYVLEDALRARRIEIEKSNGVVRTYQLARGGREVSPQDTVLTWSRARQVARAFVRRAGASAVAVGDVAAISESFDETDPSYLFLFSLCQGELELPVRFSVRIDGSTGAVLTYETVNYLPVRVSTVPAISRERACATALESATHLDQPLVSETRLAVWTAFWRQDGPGIPDPAQQALVWKIYLTGRERQEWLTLLHGAVPVWVPVSAEVWVDAATGEECFALSHGPGEGAVAVVVQQLPPEPTDIAVCDGAPAWGGAGSIYFGTTRRTLHPSASYRRPDRCSSIFRIDLDSGRLLSIVPDALTYAPSYPAPSPNGDLLSFSVIRDTVVLDLRSGKHLFLGRRQEGGHQGTWAPDGKSILVSATRIGRQSRAIYRVALALDSLTPRGYSAVTDTTGDAIHPVTSPDGTWLAYVEERFPQPGKPSSSVYVQALSEAGLPEGAAREVMGQIADAESLSAFSDGRRLMLCRETGVDVIDVLSGRHEALMLGSLHDPDLPEGEALLVHGACPSPDGEKMAFSGLRWSGRPDDAAGWYIYTCNLDGSDVRRVTPLEDEPVKPYTYPVTGRSAFDVADEIAEVRAAAPAQ